ncbi:MAG: ASCH domain-containing protein [Burkholderiales bacterium]|nr:ASCH domain-containing protein [Burkholderiales bacterium]
MPPITVLLEKLAAAGVQVPAGPVRADGYGDSAELSNELIELIRTGPKRAGTSLLWAMEIDGDAMPRVGDLEIVVDHNHEPVLLTRITRVDVLPFNEVSAEYAAIEGEGDGSLEYWRQGHWRFFSRECARVGLEPKPDMPVVCSVFELLAAVPRGAAQPFVQPDPLRQGP